MSGLEKKEQLTWKTPELAHDQSAPQDNEGNGRRKRKLCSSTSDIHLHLLWSDKNTISRDMYFDRRVKE